MGVIQTTNAPLDANGNLPVNINNTSPIPISGTVTTSIATGASAGGVQGALTMTTAGTVYEAKSNTTALANRNLLTITPTTADIFWGWSNTVTTSTGTKISKDITVIFELNASSTAKVYLVSASNAVNVRITETV